MAAHPLIGGVPSADQRPIECTTPSYDTASGFVRLPGDGP
jgi:hypothetical protein